jgi:hypothetical protein
MSIIKTALNRLRAPLLALCSAIALASTLLVGVAPISADAALNFSTTVRTARAQAVITAAGAGAKLKMYNGTRPASLGAVTGGNTLLATVTFGSTIGTATAGTLDFDEAGATQTNTSHVTGTPTFADITTSADVVVMRIDIAAGAGNWQVSGTVTNGQNVTLTSLLITEGNS